MCITSTDIKVSGFMKRTENEKEVLVEAFCIDLIS